MDGLNLKITGKTLDDYFIIDKYGSFIPDPSKLQMEKVTERLQRQLNAKTGLFNRLAKVYERTDVVFTDNPLGNTPVIGAGYKLFGSRPYRSSKRKLDDGEGIGQKTQRQLDARQEKLANYQKEIMALHAENEPADEMKGDKLIWQVEGDQVLTGGGFDNNEAGGVHKSALHFVTDSTSQIDYENSVLSELVVEGSLWLKDLLAKEGLVPGSLKPVGATVARAAQDKDGMFGLPVMSQGNKPLTEDLAMRLLIESGVDTRHLVGKTIIDATTKVTYPFRVIDAGGFILDNSVLSASDVLSIVVLLARIQKHGFTYTNGELIPKSGKTRSVYVNSFIPAIIEAMVMSPFIERLKEIKLSILPSLQDKPTRVEMIKKQIINAFDKEYDYLAADWDKYDASVKGSILATIIQHAVKPFFHADYYDWVDMATYILTYKYLVLDTDIAAINPEEFAKAKEVAINASVKQYTIFGITDGLPSGAKFTHVGGSFYGEVVVHYCIPRLMGYEPISGPQAGDDTLMGVPISLIDVSSTERTYQPIFDAASKFGLTANVSKQIWHQADGEIVKVFLQEIFHYNLNLWGIGSSFRYLSSMFTAEMDKGLSVAEQMMQEIARANQGYDNPFVHVTTRFWLNYERYLGWLFQEHGVNGFQVIIETIGLPVDELAQRVDVGSFTFGVEKADLEAGTLPILPIMADVTSQMEFSSEDRAPFVAESNPNDEDNSIEGITEEPDSMALF